MRRTRLSSVVMAPLLAGALLLSACGDDSDSASGGDCENPETITDGVLTIATGEPAFPPYVVNDATPEDGQGFESAVAMAVARELGFEGAAVTWVRTGFEEAIAPGPKAFDFNLQQYTITDSRAEAVDFSDGYYTAAQAVFGLESSAGSGVKTLDDIKGLKIGVASGTTSVAYIEDVIKPDADAAIFNDNAGVKQALEANQIDVAVSDLPTALFMTAVELTDAAVFGQIEGSGTDEFGLLLAKDSPLTDCVNEALGRLKESNELDTITTEWMSDWSGAPIIKAG